MARRFSFTNISFLVIGFSFLYIPIIFMMLYSFNDVRSTAIWGGFSTKWYVSLMQNDDMMEAAWISLKIAFISASLSTILGTMTAYALTKKEVFYLKNVFANLSVAPLVIPEVITGAALLLFFISIGLDRGFLTVTLAHSTYLMCFSSVIISSKLSELDKSMEESAIDLGCSPADAFYSVVLPLIFPAIFSAWLLSFILSFGNFVLSSFTSGPSSTTLPVKIFSAIKVGINPEINALSTIFIVVVTICVVLSSIYSKLNIGKDSA